MPLLFISDLFLFILRQTILIELKVIIGHQIFTFVCFFGFYAIKSPFLGRHIFDFLVFFRSKCYRKINLSPS